MSLISSGLPLTQAAVGRCAAVHLCHLCAPVFGSCAETGDTACVTVAHLYFVAGEMSNVRKDPFVRSNSFVNCTSRSTLCRKSRARPGRLVDTPESCGVTGSDSQRHRNQFAQKRRSASDA